MSIEKWLASPGETMPVLLCAHSIMFVILKNDAENDTWFCTEVGKQLKLYNLYPVLFMNNFICNVESLDEIILHYA